MGLIGLMSLISPIVRQISPIVRQAWDAVLILARMLSRLVFFLLLFLTVIFKSPPMALALGLGFGFGFANPYAKQTRSLSKTLLQASVVGLGFGMNLRDVLRAGSSGFGYTALGISATMVIGVALGRWLKVERVSALLISVGTAICGGSAIAAVGPVAGANDEEMSVSLGTVFILNSIALLIFPFIGHGFGLNESQFGLWAALAIHDTSSVVGATAKYGAGALAIGTTVKLARALWIVPMAVGTALVKRREARIQWPWFILFFCVAAMIRTWFPGGQGAFDLLREIARVGLTVTLFLIGCGISKKTLRAVGARPLAQGVILWLIVGVLSLAIIRAGVIGL
ncbi:MAG TPA: putative sulfate exporter family transporter [Blastocatellia bacterium]|nr:putative sulfate exporter family transporter [Blastocatellia bacterium]